MRLNFLSVGALKTRLRVNELHKLMVGALDAKIGRTGCLYLLFTAPVP
jgi:hypothetical protein